jgi:hypothetical protein
VCKVFQFDVKLKDLFFCLYSVLIEGVKYYANKPNMIGKTFLRLERDFDKHVIYCRDEPQSKEFLANNDEAREFFEVSFLFSLFHSTPSAVNFFNFDNKKVLWQLN